MDGNLDSVVAAALADAVSHTGLPEHLLSIAETATVIWRDGSLGCPEPGVGYTQVLVPGYRVRLRAGSQILNYHASRTGRLLLCPQGRAEDPLRPDAM